MSKNINLVKSDIGNLFEELESVAKEAKLEEKKRKDYVETTETDLSNLFTELEKVSQETKKLDEEDKDIIKRLAIDKFKKINHYQSSSKSLETIDCAISNRFNPNG